MQQSLKIFSCHVRFIIRYLFAARQRILESMQPKLAVIRALSFILARRMVRLATAIALIVVVVLLALTWLLATQVSGWWWLLLLPIVPAALLVGGLLVVANLIVRSLYRVRLSKEQTEKLRAFADKIQRLAESRGLGWPLLVILSLKDLLIHRELRTIIELVKDASSLQRDFSELERLLQR